jgi:c-di-GMP-binding flagellar brake protein YcgR
MNRPEQRTTERIATTLAVRVERDGKVFEGETVNLSLGGMLLNVVTDPPPRVGERWDVSVVLPTLEQPLRAQAEVRWIGLASECGVQFSTGFRARETWALGQWLDRIRKGPA